MLLPSGRFVLFMHKVLFDKRFAIIAAITAAQPASFADGCAALLLCQAGCKNAEKVAGFVRDRALVVVKAFAALGLGTRCGFDVRTVDPQQQPGQQGQSDDSYSLVCCVFGVLLGARLGVMPCGLAFAKIYQTKNLDGG